jgi:hypothetical protein
MDEADRRGRWLILGKDNLNSTVQDRLRDLIGQDACDAEAGGRSVDRRFRSVAAFDWNCPQHITPRFSEAELGPALAPFRARLEALEEENKALRDELAAIRQPFGSPGTATPNA